MICVDVRVVVEDTAVGPQGVKEAIAMDLEKKYGYVKILRVDVQEPEQLGMDGFALPRPTGRPDASACSAPPGGQAPADHRPRRPRPYVPKEIQACFNCAQYRKLPGWDDAGQGFYGRCAVTDRPIYTLGNRCRAWKGVT